MDDLWDKVVDRLIDAETEQYELLSLEAAAAARYMGDIVKAAISATDVDRERVLKAVALAITGHAEE